MAIEVGSMVSQEGPLRRPLTKQALRAEINPVQGGNLKTTSEVSVDGSDRGSKSKSSQLASKLSPCAKYYDCGSARSNRPFRQPYYRAGGASRTNIELPLGDCNGSMDESSIFCKNESFVVLVGPMRRLRHDNN
ncbi:hypothetical protein MAP00_005568 [Monascus purpureus]|nr:hypothetical protein MAP00_005568 [Monascus purpureus]